MSGRPHDAVPTAANTPLSRDVSTPELAWWDLAQGAIAAACTLLIVFTILAWALL